MSAPNPKPPAPPLEALRAFVSRGQAAQAAVDQLLDVDHGYRAMRAAHAHLALQIVDLENRMAAIEQFFRAQNTGPAPARRRRARR